MPFLEKKGEYLNLRGIISVISKLTWYIYIGARLFEVGLSIKYTCARRVSVVILKNQSLLRPVSFTATILAIALLFENKIINLLTSFQN
jgi:hypothetical protein